MKNRCIVLMMPVMILAFAMIFGSCSEVLSFTVPKWAQGTWYATESLGILDGVARPEAVQITAKEFIPKSILDSLPILERKDVTLVTDNTVFFDLIQIKKGINSSQIEIGVGAASSTITLYK